MDEKPAIAEPVKKPKRRWFHFSLRMLLVGIVLLSLPLGWLGSKVQEARRRQAAVTAIEKLGGQVMYDYQFATQGRIAFGRFATQLAPPGPAWLRNLFGDDVFSNVIAVSLSYRAFSGAELKQFTFPLQFTDPDTDVTPVTDAELGYVSGLTELKYLDLSGGLVTDAGLARIGGLTQLKALLLDGTRVTDAGLENLRGMSELEILWLNDLHVTDAGLEHLGGFSRLSHLSLFNAKVTDAGLKHLRRLTQLTDLGLVYTQLTDAGLELLSGLPQLTMLDLGSTRVTDAGLEKLYGLKRLTWLGLVDTRVSAAGVAKLQQALPNCQISR
jgi:hypothetical protein